MTAKPLLVTLKEFEKYAANKIPQNTWAYYESGAGDEFTLKDSEKAYKRYLFLPKMMKGISSRNMETTLLGKKVKSPIQISPTAYQRLAHPDGEIATVRAATKEGVCMILSTFANSSIEEIASATKSMCESSSAPPKWLQLYIHEDRTITENLIARAEKEGFDGLVLTVDSPIIGLRNVEISDPVILPHYFSMANFDAIFDINMSESEKEDIACNVTADITWSDIGWIRERTSLPIIAKGILTGHDAKLARQYGASAVLVSNHGGRQLDSVPTSIEALSEVVKSVPDDFEVYLDGGIRTGNDVMKALCLGARAVFIGRPVLWGLAYDGEKGVSEILKILKNELNAAMALLGVKSLEEADQSFVIHRSKYEAKL